VVSGPGVGGTNLRGHKAGCVAHGQCGDVRQTDSVRCVAHGQYGDAHSAILLVGHTHELPCVITVILVSCVIAVM